jgi:hypothetical protein
MMLMLVAALFTAEPECLEPEDCMITTQGDCCECCPVAPHATSKKKEEVRCAKKKCPHTTCKKDKCAKQSTDNLSAVCRESRCVMEVK